MYPSIYLSIYPSIIMCIYIYIYISYIYIYTHTYVYIYIQYNHSVFPFPNSLITTSEAWESPVFFAAESLHRILPQRVILEMLLKGPVEIVEHLLGPLGPTGGHWGGKAGASKMGGKLQKGKLRKTRMTWGFLVEIQLQNLALALRVYGNHPRSQSPNSGKLPRPERCRSLLACGNQRWPESNCECSSIAVFRFFSPNGFKVQYGLVCKPIKYYHEEKGKYADSIWFTIKFAGFPWMLGWCSPLEIPSLTRSQMVGYPVWNWLSLSAMPNS